MADLQKTDLFLVNRNNSSYTIEAQRIMADLQDTDLMLVNRGGQSYKATGADIKNSLGEPSISPDPGDVTSPGFEGGDGTQGNPYIIPTTAAFPYGGSAESSIEITFTNANWKDVIRFVDENEDTNGEERFLQPLGVVGEDGTYTTRLYYTDSPASTTNTTYNSLLSVGESVYFQWAVNQTDTVAPVIGSVDIIDPDNGSSGFGGNTFTVQVDYDTEGKPDPDLAISLSAATSASVRPGTSAITSSEFIDCPEIEFGYISSSVLIAAKDVGWSAMGNLDTTDPTLAQALNSSQNFSWLGIRSTNGQPFSPTFEYKGYSDRSLYSYWYTSDTGDAGSWVFKQAMPMRNGSSWQFSTPYGASKYWMVMVSSLSDIDTNESRGGIYDYRPNENSGRYENPQVSHFHRTGDSWGVQKVVLSDTSNLSLLRPGYTIFHTDSAYKSVPVDSTNAGWRYQTWYIEMEEADTYPPIVSESTIWQYLSANYYWMKNGEVKTALRWFNGANEDPNWSIQPNMQITDQTAPPDTSVKGAIIYDLGEITATTTIKFRNDSNFNVSYATDGGGWSPVVTSGSGGVSIPAGTRWMAVMQKPGSTYYNKSNYTYMYGWNKSNVDRRIPDNSAQCALIDIANKTVYLSSVEGSFAAGAQKNLIQIAPSFDESNQVTVYPWIDANGNVTAIKSTPQTAVVQNSDSGNITFPTTLSGDITVNSMLPFGTSIKAYVEASNVAGSDSATTDAHYPVPASLTVSYDAIKWGNRSNSISFTSDDFSFPYSDEMVFWLLWAEGATTTGGSATRQFYTENGWYGNISGGNGGWGDDGNKNPGGNGKPPRGGFYLSYRRYTRVKVTGVDGNGGVTSYEVLEEGKGLNSINEGQNKEFVGGNGSGVQFTVVKDSGSKLTTVSGIGDPGSGYTVNDIVRWEEGLGQGGTNQMDLDWDQILHGFAGANNLIVGTEAGTNGSSASNTLLDGKGTNLIPKSGGGGASYTCDYCNGGFGGSAGWGGAPSVGGGNPGSKPSRGHSAGSGYSTYATGISGQVLSGGTTQGFSLYLNGGRSATFTQENQIHSFYVRDN